MPWGFEILRENICKKVRSYYWFRISSLVRLHQEDALE